MKNKLIAGLLTISSLVLNSAINIEPANSSSPQEHADTAFYMDAKWNGGKRVVFDDYQEMKSYVEKKARLLDVAIPPEPTNYSDDHDIYYEVIAYGDAYYINVGYGLNGEACNGGNVCYIGAWNAVKVYDDNHMPLKQDHLDKNVTYSYVELENEYQAIHINWCGAYCRDSLYWTINGATYSLHGKGGKQTVDQANSIYN